MAVLGSAFHLSPTAVHDHALVLVVSPRDSAPEPGDITIAYTIDPEVAVVPLNNVGEAVRRIYAPIMDDDEAALAKHDVDTRLVELRQGIASMPSDDVFCGCVVSVPPHHFGLAVQLHLLPTLKSGLFDPMQQRLIPLWAPKVVSGVLHPGEDWLTPFRERVELSDSVESRTIDVGHLRSFGKLSPREYARWKEGVSLLGRLSGIGRSVTRFGARSASSEARAAMGERDSWRGG